MRTDGDLCDFSASVSDGLRSVAGFPGSMEARSAACSTAEGGGINNLLLLLEPSFTHGRTGFSHTSLKFEARPT